MMKIRLFYYYRQTYLLYYLRKNFNLIIYTEEDINVFVYLFWLHFLIKKSLFTYLKYLLNYRYFLRNYRGEEKNRFLFLFYTNCTNKFSLKMNFFFLQHINNSYYFIFFFSRFLFYYYYILIFFRALISFKKNYFLLKNYFFSKLSYRCNYFELFWTLFEIVPKHWLRIKNKSFLLKQNNYRWKLTRKRSWFSHLFHVSSGIETFFNIHKDSSFLILAKKTKVNVKVSKFKPTFFKVKRYRQPLIRTFIKKLKKNLFGRLRWRRFGWFFKLKRKKKYLRMPKRLKTQYFSSKLLKRFQYKYLTKKLYKKKRRYKIVKLFRNNFARKSFNFLKKEHTLNRIDLFLNYNILKKVLIFLSSSSVMQSITKVRVPYSFFSNFRLIFTIFSEGSFIKNLLYVNREKRYLILFNFLKSKFLKKNINKSLYNFMSNSNVIYHFFIPKICRNLLLKIYRRKKLFGFSWIFFLQLSNLFSNLFSSNLSFNLNFVDSERLNRSFLNNMFSKFLLFNPPKSKYQFLKELCDIYLMTGLTKDSNFLHQWIIKNLSIIFFRRHWQFLGFLKMTLLYVFKILEHHFGLKGIFITFRGKIGQVGSVRKKVYFLQQGTHALSNLSLKSSFNTSVTKTDTGAIGVSVYLFY